MFGPQANIGVGFPFVIFFEVSVNCSLAPAQNTMMVFLVGGRKKKTQTIAPTKRISWSDALPSEIHCLQRSAEPCQIFSAPSAPRSLRAAM